MIFRTGDMNDGLYLFDAIWRVPSNDDGIDFSSFSENDDEYNATSVEEKAHSEGNTENLNHSDESEFFENNDDEINPSDQINYDDVLEMGYSQREGIDYDESFSPVVKMSTIRCLISITVKNKWPLWKLDVNNAFLYGELEEDVYMSLPEGYKSIGCVLVALLVYVDDIIISGNDTSEIENIKTFLSSKFQIKDLGKLKYFLGIEVIKSGNDICLTQRKYCIRLLHEFGMLGCKLVSIPMEPNTVLNFKPSQEDPPLVNITGYLKGSPSKGLRYVYNPDQSASADEMLGYSDFDW
nr:hypothetical protein [Tanacetum cinerariifolium]